MSYTTTQGAELEIQLITNDGFIANRASEILLNPKVKNEQLAVKEGVQSQLEINNSKPHRNINDLAREIVYKLKSLEKICRKENLLIVPISEYGAGRGERNNSLDRFEVYDKILGKKDNERLITVSGTHVHSGRQPNLEKRLTQHRVLTALDPLIALASTSPIDVNGINGLNCHRAQLLRYELGKNKENEDENKHESFLEGGLENYIASLEELNLRDVYRFLKWENKFVKNGGDIKRFRSLFKVDNTGYSLVRDRPNFKPNGTFESRAFDACPIDALLGIVAIIKGVQDRIFNENIKVRIAEDTENFQYSSKEIILPHFYQLKSLEQSAIKYGLVDNKVTNYIKRLVEFAEGGLAQDERKYLGLITEMLEHQDNYATEVMALIKNYGCLNEPVDKILASKANLYMAERSKQATSKVEKFVF